LRQTFAKISRSVETATHKSHSVTVKLCDVSTLKKGLFYQIFYSSIITEFITSDILIILFKKLEILYIRFFGMEFALFDV